MTPRSYQNADVAAVIDAHKTHQCVIGRAATGLGKACELAMLAAHYVQFGRVMILVDVKKLVRQLARTIEQWTGIKPGIEMGEESADMGGGFFAREGDRIIISTVQTQYSEIRERPRYHQFKPSAFSALLLDECECFVSKKEDDKKYRKVVDWYIEGNKALRLFGCSATTNRTDGIAMAHLFEHVAFDRDITWGIREGWLVPARQAFVRVSVDFSTLKLRKNDDGEKDYSAEQIAEAITNDKTLIELASGIIRVAENRRSIIVCPNVAAAVSVSDYLNAQRPDCAKSVYGTMDDESKDKVMDQHQEGNFQFLVSVMMLTKGYDDRKIRAIFNCRKTRSKRLYTQIMGRGTRPLEGTVDGVEAAEDRRAAIAASEKPECLMCNMVGINEKTRDITIVDILGNKKEHAVVQRAKRLEMEGMEAADAIEQAEKEIAVERAEKNREAEEAYEQIVADEMARLRQSMRVENAEVDVQYYADQPGIADDNINGIKLKHLDVLRRFKVPEDDIRRMSPDKAKDMSRELIRRRRAGLCSYKQGKCLLKFNYSKDEISGMTFEDAGIAITNIKENGWKRPIEESV